MYTNLSLQEKIVHNNFLMGLIFWKCLRVALKKYKFLMGIWIFWILYTPVKNLRVISARITPCEIKLEIRRILSINLIIFFFCIDFFYSGFPAKFWGFRKNWDFHTFCLAWFLKGFQAKKRLVLHVLCPSHPCASLARTVLKPLSFAQAIHALVLHVLCWSL